MDSDARDRAEVPAIELAGRHRVDIRRGDGVDALELVAHDGKILLSIEISERGPVLRFDGPALTIRARAAPARDAQNLPLRPEISLTLTPGGDLEFSAPPDLRSTARQQKITAELGDVRVEANDDVRLDGERVLVNC